MIPLDSYWRTNRFTCWWELQHCGVFLACVSCGYEKDHAQLDYNVTKFSAIIYFPILPRHHFNLLTDQFSILRHRTPMFNTVNTSGCQLRTKLNPIYVFKTCSLLKVTGVLFVNLASYSAFFGFNIAGRLTMLVFHHCLQKLTINTGCGWKCWCILKGRNCAFKILVRPPVLEDKRDSWCCVYTWHKKSKIGRCSVQT
jgi:hypothetical protein